MTNSESPGTGGGGGGGGFGAFGGFLEGLRGFLVAPAGGAASGAGTAPAAVAGEWPAPTARAGDPAALMAAAAAAAPGARECSPAGGSYPKLRTTRSGETTPPTPVAAARVVADAPDAAAESSSTISMGVALRRTIQRKSPSPSCRVSALQPVGAQTQAGGGGRAQPDACTAYAGSLLAGCTPPPRLTECRGPGARG